jgi:DNA polymerase/3'-5' exonuclease PolX
LGSYRLGKIDSGDIDLVLYKDKMEDKKRIIKKVLNVLDNMIIDIISEGKSKVMMLVKLPDTEKEFKPHKVRHLDMIFIEERELPWWELYFGSDVNFSRKIREYASKEGYKLNEYGIFDKGSGKRIDFNPKKEEEIFKFLGLKYVKPKDRATIGVLKKI